MEIDLLYSELTDTSAMPPLQTMRISRHALPVGNMKIVRDLVESDTRHHHSHIKEGSKHAVQACNDHRDLKSSAS